VSEGCCTIAPLSNNWIAYAVGVLFAIGLVLVAVNAIFYNRRYDTAASKFKVEIVELKVAAVEARDKEQSRQEAANNAEKAREVERIA